MTIVDHVSRYTGFVETSKYDGEWKDDKFHGKGIYISDCGCCKYDGDWRNGKKHGQGTLIREPAGDLGVLKYVGEWKDDKKHGFGISSRRKHIYMGHWKEGLRHDKNTKYCYGQSELWETNQFNNGKYLEY